MTGIQEEQSVLYRVIGKVGLVTLNRPSSMNAFTTSMARQFNETIGRATTDSSIRVIVITGAGERAFCAGADLKERNGMSPEQWNAQHKVFEEKNERIRNSSKPVIGAIKGIAVGGGLELALQMDFLFASSDAKFGQPEVKRGIMPGGGGTQWLPRKVPLGMAMQMLFSGETISANEALRVGLVNAVLPANEVVSAAIDVAQKIAVNSPTAISQAKKSVRLGLEIPIETALGIELQCYSRMVDHPDRHEGIKAFVEKRTPQFLDTEG